MEEICLLARYTNVHDDAAAVVAPNVCIVSPGVYIPG